jgi:hypothetical protein
VQASAAESEDDRPSEEELLAHMTYASNAFSIGCHNDESIAPSFCNNRFDIFGSIADFTSTCTEFQHPG